MAASQHKPPTRHNSYYNRPMRVHLLLAISLLAPASASLDPPAQNPPLIPAPLGHAPTPHQSPSPPSPRTTPPPQKLRARLACDLPAPQPRLAAQRPRLRRPRTGPASRRRPPPRLPRQRAQPRPRPVPPSRRLRRALLRLPRLL